MSKRSARTEVLGVVLPGDVVKKLDPGGQTDSIFIGPGLRQHEGAIYATRSGVLNVTGKNLYYVDSHQKRYVPQKDEFVIGIITKKKGGDNYLINIAGNEVATISHLAFENDVRKARKNLRPGDLIFGKLLVANKDMEPELVSIDIANNAIGVAGLPEGGIMFNVALHVARWIANPKNTYLKTIAKKIKFTIVVGFNGRVWLSSERMTDLVAVMNCVLMLEVMPLEEAEQNVHSIINSFLKL